MDLTQQLIARHSQGQLYHVTGVSISCCEHGQFGIISLEVGSDEVSASWRLDTEINPALFDSSFYMDQFETTFAVQ